MEHVVDVTLRCNANALLARGFLERFLERFDVSTTAVCTCINLACVALNLFITSSKSLNF